MLHDTQPVGVFENYFPLVELTAIEAISFITIGVGPYILAISENVHCQEIEAIHSF